MIDPGRVIVALDLVDIKRAADVANRLRDKAQIMKVGAVAFTAFGTDFIRMLTAFSIRPFLDLKFHDIPNTVAAATVEAAKTGVHMMTLHAMGGREMMKQAASRVEAHCSTQGAPRPKLLAVTVLTSHSEQSLVALGVERPLQEQVVALAHDALEAGMDGVVASVKETEMLRSRFGDDLIIVTPGIRPAGRDVHDQVRVATPKQAFDAGASYIVVGRPIVQADDPVAAFDDIISSD